MTERELEILNLIKADPLISQYELADILGITRSGVAAHIHNLMKKGYIKGRGYVINQPNFVVVIGGINIDIMGIPAEKLIENNSNPGKIYHSLGGAGRNIALTLTKLEVPNYFISVYGDDMNGEEFVLNAKENEMDIQYCTKIPHEHTSSFLYIDDVDGNKTIGIDDMTIYNQMTPHFIQTHMDKISHAQFCIIDTNLPHETIDYLYEKASVPIVIKTTSINKNRRLISSKQKIHTLITTKSEALNLANNYTSEALSWKQAIQLLLTKGIQNIVIFSIKEGLFFQNQELSYQQKQNSSFIKNTNGANAVFTGTFIWGLQQGFGWETLLNYAYDAVLLSIKSQEAVSPALSPHYLLEYPKKIAPLN